MNNKGFTLIELLIVIAILGTLGVIITVNLTKTMESSKQKTCDTFVKEVEDAACVYVGLENKEVICNRSNCAPIKLKYLEKEGLLKSESDACTGGDINLEETVTVTWDSDGEKKCEYNGVRKYER